MRNITENITTFDHAFSEPEDLKSYIKVWQDQLKLVVTEYENFSRTLVNDTSTLPITKLPELMDLTNLYSDSVKRQLLEKNHAALLKLIRRDILKG